METFDLVSEYYTAVPVLVNTSTGYRRRSIEHSAYYTVTSDETRGTVEIRIRQNAAMAVPVYE